MKFDDFWRTESVKIAALEQLEVQGVLTLDTLFSRALDIYNKGYEYDIDSWNSLWSEKTKELPENEIFKEHMNDKKPTHQKIQEGVNNEIKTCPGCGEDIPNSWKKHSYKKDGGKCGYNF